MDKAELEQRLEKLNVVLISEDIRRQLLEARVSKRIKDSEDVSELTVLFGGAIDFVNNKLTFSDYRASENYHDFIEMILKAVNDYGVKISYNE